MTNLTDVKRAPFLFAFLLLMNSLLLTACGQPFWLPPAYKIEVQQGNLINTKQRQQMQIGMSREELLAVAGSPVMEGVFHQNQWDYVYARGPAGTAVVARSVTIEFEDNKVISIKDNFNEESGEVPIQRYWWQRLLGGD
jgi:outer membrane protein assembly factor BamE